MKINKILIIAIAVIVIVLVIIGYKDIKFCYFLTVADKFYVNKQDYIWQLYRLNDQYINSCEKQIAINEKILRVDSTRIEPLYALGFWYMQLSNKEKYLEKDEEKAAFWHKKSLDALRKYVIRIRPDFGGMSKVADLNYSFGYPDTALIIYRDISHLIESDSILILGDEQIDKEKKFEYMRRVVEKETTFIKMKLE